ncbi:uncharacterized protein BcabD6B2_38090 [Babesia caballi]|uniref:Uncharacterized protein n=1 Tax=Babesia caballi TaxID=5871 RepID=A0AAV4LWC5_BABCB|nr:hypothetical protein, conserved [Babesia caballi]
MKMTSGGKSLTTPPTNLKEAIDWLVLVGSDKGWGWHGNGMYDHLEEALKKLPGFDKTAYFNKRFRTDGLSDYISRSAQALRSGFLGYSGSLTFSGSGIVKKEYSNYQSAYKDDNWNSDGGLDYAKIFLFLAPLVYYFITFLYWMCNSSGKWQGITINGSNPLSKFFKAMGYDQSQLDEKKTGTTIASALDGNAGSPELKGAYQSGGSSSYENFLRNLKQNDPSKRPAYPLTNCKICSYEYLQSRHSGTDITNAIGAIKKELVSISARGHSSSTDNFSDLKQKVETLLGKIHTFDPNAVPSPVAPLAGTLTTLAAAGGAGTAYGLNLGGAKTFVNGLLRIS